MNKKKFTLIKITKIAIPILHQTFNSFVTEVPVI